MRKIESKKELKNLKINSLKYLILLLMFFCFGILAIITYNSYSFFKVNSENEIIKAKVGDFSTSKEYAYTGEAQEFKVARSGYYEIELWGAEGGGTSSSYQVINEVTHQSGNFVPGGKGAYTKGVIYLERNEKIYIYVGGKGSDGEVSSSRATGGYNGGGQGGYGYQGAGGGGGATDIRLVNGAWDNTSSLISRIMVASGGGGTNNYIESLSSSGANGGALIGNSGYYPDNLFPAIGGSQTSGGAHGGSITNEGVQDGTFGIGGNSQVYHGGGGGAGYYGGGGAGYTDKKVGSGASGSSYISGYAGVNSVQETGGTPAQPLHTNNTIHYSGKYFIKGIMEAGVNSGNGKAKITYIGKNVEKTNTKLDNVRYIKSCLNGNNISAANAWVEIQAIKDGINVVKNKNITGSVPEATTFPYSRIIDGNIDSSVYSNPGTLGGLQCVTIDLEASYNLDEIGLWLYWEDGRKYYSNTLSVGAENASGTNNLATIIHSYTTDGENSQGRRYSAYYLPEEEYVNSGLILHYDGINNTGNGHSNTSTVWKDLSGSGNHTTAYYAPISWGPTAFSGNGDTSGFSLPTSISSLIATKSFTIELVLRPVTLTKRDILIGNYGTTPAFNIERNSSAAGFNGATRFYWNGGSPDIKLANAITSTTIGGKTSLTVSVGGNTIKSYIVGTLKDNITSTLTAITPTNLYLGRDSRTGATVFFGEIYSVRIYNRVLTDTEIKQNQLVDENRFDFS